MVRGLQRLLTADPGFEFERVVVLDPSLDSYGIKGESARSYWLNVKRDIAAHPESESVTLVSAAPLGNNLSESTYKDAPDLKVTRVDVESEFFSLMRIPVLAGRKFEPADDYRSAAIISRRLAVGMYGNMDVVGKAFPKTEPRKTIVGVVDDARIIKIQATNVAEEYSPLNPQRFEGLLLLCRAKASPERLLGPLRAAARRADNRVLAQARMMKSDFEKKLQAPRLSSLVASLTGSLALLLACTGIFGLVAYGVTLRTKEIGIRVALGAPRVSIVVLLLRQLTWPIGCGIVLGAVIGMWAGRFLEGHPFYLNATDPAAPMTSAWILILSSGLAAILPARRALRIDPMQALRHE